MNKQSRTTAAAGACRLQLTSLSTWGQRYQPSFRPKVAVLIGCLGWKTWDSKVWMPWKKCVYSIRIYIYIFRTLYFIVFHICQNRVFVVQCHSFLMFFSTLACLLMSYFVWLAMCGWSTASTLTAIGLGTSEVPFAGPSQIRAHAQKTVAWASKMLPMAVQWVLLEF